MAKNMDRNKEEVGTAGPGSLDNVKTGTTPGTLEGTPPENTGSLEEEIVEFWGVVSPIIPISEPIERYSGFRHIDLKLTPKQSQAIQRTRKALHDNHCKLRSGKHVDSFVDTLKYILERVEDGVDTFEESRSKSR